MKLRIREKKFCDISYECASGFCYCYCCCFCDSLFATAQRLNYFHEVIFSIKFKMMRTTQGKSTVASTREREKTNSKIMAIQVEKERLNYA